MCVSASFSPGTLQKMTSFPVSMGSKLALIFVGRGRLASLKHPPSCPQTDIHAAISLHTKCSLSGRRFNADDVSQRARWFQFHACMFTQVHVLPGLASERQAEGGVSRPQQSFCDSATPPPPPPLRRFPGKLVPRQRSAEKSCVPDIPHPDNQDCRS